MSMRHMATQNSNQWTTQGGWRYTPCGKWITSRTYKGHVDICPNPTSSGTVSTPRTLSSRMVTIMQGVHIWGGQTDCNRQTPYT